MDNIRQIFDQQKAALTNHISATERRAMLTALWDAVLAHESRLIDALHLDMGKPREEVHLQEIYPLKAEIMHARRHLRGWMAPKPMSTSLALLGTASHVLPEPKGQTLIIAPWNFPVILTLRPFVSAIAAGNRVMLKPSEHTPATSKVIASIVETAFEPEMASVILGGPEISQSLTSLPFQHICFTGGTNIGRKVMKAAAKHLASVTLELGGKSPAVVDETANIVDASRRMAWGKCLNNGQVCIAPDYLLVNSAIADRFIEELKSRFADMYGQDERSQLLHEHRSQMVNQHHFERVVGLIQDALERGATLVHGGVWDASSRRIAPTVLDNVTMEMAIMNEEIFGPVLPLIRWNQDEEVNAIVAHNPHPLAMYFFSKRKDAIQAWMQANPAGTTAINEVVLQVASPNLPFGGIQTSGMGRTGGIEGFKQFSNMRSVLKQTSRLNALPWTFPPFTDRSLWFARNIQRWL